jgi:tetratricopeptide (TPR) repeat protein
MSDNQRLRKSKVPCIKKIEHQRNSMINDIISESRKAREDGDMEKALSLLEHPSLKDHPEALFLAGEICYNMQNWGAALNNFRQSLHIDPDQPAARTYVDLILNILGFFHTDQFNP